MGQIIISKQGMAWSPAHMHERPGHTSTNPKFLELPPKSQDSWDCSQDLRFYPRSPGIFYSDTHVRHTGSFLPFPENLEKYVLYMRQNPKKHGFPQGSPS